MIETIELVKEAGIPGIVLTGEPYYYPRFGFDRCKNHGITDMEGNTYDALMCLPLVKDFSEIKDRFIESSINL